MTKSKVLYFYIIFKRTLLRHYAYP
uniref:Uncharacterized protein n=1 Tax=Heterorhabditis bacteriophora TaxID=37862 RepID=A0A1I7WV90_HETBA